MVVAHLRRFLPMLTLVAAACGADAIVSAPADSKSRTIFASVGQEVQITLGNVGPAKYESPPQISSGAVSFIGVDVIPPFTPAGPTQQFRFRAARPGDAVVHFRRMSSSNEVVFVVEDTIRVR